MQWKYKSFTVDYEVQFDRHLWNKSETDIFQGKAMIVTHFSSFSD